MSDQSIRPKTINDILKEISPLISNTSGAVLIEHTDRHILIEVADHFNAVDLNDSINSLGYVTSMSKAGFHSFVRLYLRPSESLLCP